MTTRPSTSNFGPFMAALERGTTEPGLRLQILALLEHHGPTSVNELMTLSGLGGSRFATFFQAVSEARAAGLIEFVGEQGKELVRLSSEGRDALRGAGGR